MGDGAGVGSGDWAEESVRQTSWVASFQYQSFRDSGSMYPVQGEPLGGAVSSGEPQREAGGLAGPAARSLAGRLVKGTSATVGAGGAELADWELGSTGGPLWRGVGEDAAAGVWAGCVH